MKFSERLEALLVEEQATPFQVDHLCEAIGQWLAVYKPRGKDVEDHLLDITRQIIRQPKGLRAAISGGHLKSHYKLKMRDRMGFKPPPTMRRIGGDIPDKIARLPKA